VVVFVDGSWWHGWRFPVWRSEIGDYWQKKIEKNRKRDKSNHRKLRRQGWTVLRFWDHQVQRNLDRIIDQVAAAVGRPDRKRPEGSETSPRPRLQIYRAATKRKR
jgi:DNA mismatch endonuclease (patch repair protein)